MKASKITAIVLSLACVAAFAGCEPMESMLPHKSTSPTINNKLTPSPSVTPIVTPDIGHTPDVVPTNDPDIILPDLTPNVTPGTTVDPNHGKGNAPDDMPFVSPNPWQTEMPGYDDPMYPNN